MTATSERIGGDAMTRQSRRIYRGIPKEKSAFGNVGSIPAKFRTLLNPKPLSASHRAVPLSTSCRREKDAFGGRVPRFVEKSEASPGPGAYHAGREGMNWRYDGLSSRGYGPIASQNERFAKCHARQFLGPGGGARGNACDVEFLVRAGSYDPSTSTRGSAPIMRRPPRRRDAPDGGGLGPGSYCTQKTCRGRDVHWRCKKPAVAPFGGMAPRQKTPKDGTPAPNAYNTGFLWPVDEAKDCQFCRYSKRDPERRENQIDALLRTKTERDRQQKEGLGPGSYFTDDSRHAETATENPSSMFARTSDETKKRPSCAGVPGPGSYDMQAMRVGSDAVAASSCFKSTCGRWNWKPTAGLVPGPAFYDTANVSLRGKQSFHLNARQRFLAL